MKKKRIVAIIVVLILLIALVVLIKKRKHELMGMKPPRQYVTVVQVAPVKKGDLDVTVRYLGEIVPITENAIASKISGFIENVFVDEGNHVKQGDTLVKIDDREIRDRIDSVEARITATRNNLLALEARVSGFKSAVSTNKGIFNRNKTLYKNKAIGKEELDISDKNYRLALSELQATQNSIKALSSTISSLEAQKSEQEVLLSYTTIKAPFDGIVSKKALSTGDLVVPGKEILRLVRPGDGIKVVIRMAPEDFMKVRIGTPATLMFDGKLLQVGVSSLYPSTSPGSLGICNIIMKESPFNLPFHTRIEARLVTNRVKGLLAPISCLLRHGSKSLVVFVNSRNEAKILPVKLLAKNEHHFCFQSPELKVGDKLASARESRLMRIFSGQKVEVVQ